MGDNDGNANTVGDATWLPSYVESPRVCLTAVCAHRALALLVVAMGPGLCCGAIRQCLMRGLRPP